MAAGTIIVLVIVLVLLAAAVTLAATVVLRRQALRHRFGAEYDQLVSQVGQRRAQAELAERRRRVAQLDIKPLSSERRAGYAREWFALQEKFVDDPAQSVEGAAALVSAVAADCGYPADDDNRLLSDLSVHHADRLDGYRQARRVAEQAGTTGTEELRQALLSFRALFRDLLGQEPAAAQPPRKAEPAASGTSQPAAAIARTVRAGGYGTGRAPETGGGTWVDSGRDDRAAAPAARKD